MCFTVSKSLLSLCFCCPEINKYVSKEKFSLWPLTVSTWHVFVYIKEEVVLGYATRHQISLSTNRSSVTSLVDVALCLSSPCSCPHQWWELRRHSLWVPLQIQWKLASRLPPRCRFPWTVLVCHLIRFWPRQKEGTLSNTWHVVLLYYHKFHYFLAISLAGCFPGHNHYINDLKCR